MRRFLTITFSTFALGGLLHAQELQARFPTADPAELTRLAGQLGDREYRVREQAGKRFAEIGADSLPTLAKIAEGGSYEASERARELSKRIEKRLLNARDTAGTKVELPAGEQTVGAACESLRKQTGYSLNVNGDQSPRSIQYTPASGKKTFWEAVEELCLAGKLQVEAVTANAVPVNLNPDQAKRDVKVSYGNVLLKAKGPTSNPVCLSGAFRIEAIPVPVAHLPQMPAHRVPAILQVFPEPRLRWVSASTPIVTVAKDQDGRELLWDHVAVEGNPRNFAYEGRGMGKRGYYGGPAVSPECPVTNFQTYLKLLAPPEGASANLKVLAGKIRGRVWSQPEAMLTLDDLGATFAEINGPNHTGMRAKYDPFPGDATALLLSVTTTYHTGEVVPQHGSSIANTEPLWLENGPGGKVKVKLTPQEKDSAKGYTNAYGLTLADGNGKPMNLSPHTATVQHHYNGNDGSTTAVVVAQYVVRPADATAESKPAKLSFYGARMRSLETDFSLKDVPVLRGAGTNVQNPNINELYFKN